MIADGLEDRLAAESGQHQVEHDEVNAVRLDRIDRGSAIADDRHRVAVALEIEPQQLAEARLVLDDQDPRVRRHASHPSRAHVQES